jgi:hypothetical protein
MMGAAWATVLSFAFMTGISYVFSQRALRLPLGFGRVGMAMTLAVGLYTLCRFGNTEQGLRGLVAKVLVLAVFPVVVWKAGMLTPSAAATISSASAAALGVISRFYDGGARRAVNQ